MHAREGCESERRDGDDAQERAYERADGDHTDLLTSVARLTRAVGVLPAARVPCFCVPESPLVCPCRPASKLGRRSPSSGLYARADGMCTLQAVPSEPRTLGAACGAGSRRGAPLALGV